VAGVLTEGAAFPSGLSCCRFATGRSCGELPPGASAGAAGGGAFGLVPDFGLAATFFAGLSGEAGSLSLEGFLCAEPAGELAFGRM
jgi:hypothetical protein